MKCTISSLDQTLAFPNASSVTVHIADGEAQILPGHAEAYFLLVPGTIRVQSPGDDRTVHAGSGECHVAADEVTIVADDIGTQ